MQTIRHKARKFTSKSFPAFIRKDPFLSKNPKITKIFPKLGLDNIKVPVQELLPQVEIDRLHLSGLSLVFSSDPWDIATMSMRGIYSCQRWSGKEQHKVRLVGSIIDPCCAVIYLTDGSKNRYGEKMLLRSVVRLVVYRNKIYLFRDRPYYSGDFDFTTRFNYVATYEILPSLLSALIKYLKLNIQILDPNTPISRQTWSCGSIPYAKILNQLPDSHLSYRDSKLDYVIFKRLPKVLKESGCFK